MNTAELQQAILELKREKDVCILAHTYQTHEILEVADLVGDSYGLSKHAATVPQSNILMCGVRFMAETAKVLSPDKRIILSYPEAGCPMAEQMTVEQIRQLRREHPEAAVVAYVNTTAELKAECDICVTSASALQIVGSLPNREIIFIPDCNLGSWVARQLPDKQFHFINGGCPVHAAVTAEEVAAAKQRHPNALLLVHPECRPVVTTQADYVGSTTGIMGYVARSDHREFIIGTENSIVQHLQYDYPDKQFYPLSKGCICPDMRLTTLNDVYRCLLGQGGEEITLPEAVRLGAKRSIDAMLRYGG